MEFILLILLGYFGVMLVGWILAIVVICIGYIQARIKGR